MKLKINSILTSAFLTLVVLLAPPNSRADGLDHWHWRNPLPQGNGLYGITFGNGQFVAVGNLGAIITSTNGLNWSVPDPLGCPGLRKVTYGNGLFVSVGDAGTIETSSDGTNWTAQNSGTPQGLANIAYGHSVYIASGANGTALVSSNAVQWSAINTGISYSFNWLASGNGVFILPTAPLGNPQISGRVAKILVSTNGTSFTQYPIPDTGSFIGTSVGQITFANGLFIASLLVSQPGDYEDNTWVFYTSSDGIHWSQGVNAPSITQNLYTANGRLFDFATGLGPVLFTSTDGQAWTPTDFPETGYSTATEDIAYGAGLYVALGINGTLLFSTNGTNWGYVSSGPANRITSLAQGNGVIVGVGAAAPTPPNPSEFGFTAPIAVSTNGQSFAYAPVTSSNQTFACVAYGATNFVAVGLAGALQYSKDGLNWLVRPAGTSTNLAGVCFGNGLFVAVGASGTVVTSPTGLAWTLRNSGTGVDLFGVTYADGQFVAVGYEGTVMTSPDGINWTAQYVDSLATLYHVIYGAGQFVAVGDAGTVITSPDGENWDVSTLPTTLPLYSVDYGAGEYVAVGSPATGYYDYENQNVVFRSYDAVTWHSLSVPTDWNLYGVSFFNGTFWLAGGDGTVLQSDTVTAPVMLMSHVMLNNGGFQLTIAGLGGKSFRVQARNGLNSGTWSDIASVSNSLPLQTWTDTNTANVTSRFYRVISP